MRLVEEGMVPLFSARAACLAEAEEPVQRHGGSAQASRRRRRKYGSVSLPLISHSLWPRSF